MDEYLLRNCDTGRIQPAGEEAILEKVLEKGGGRGRARPRPGGGLLLLPPQGGAAAPIPRQPTDFHQHVIVNFRTPRYIFNAR